VVKSFLENRRLQKTQPGTSWAKEEEEKGLQGRLRGSVFATLILSHSWFGAALPLQGPNPDVRGLTVPGQESRSRALSGAQQGLGNEGLAWLQLTAFQPSLTMSASPCSALGELSGPGCANPCLTQHKAWTPPGPSQPQIAQAVVALLCRCFSQPKKDTGGLNIIKHLDAFPFPTFLPTTQQRFRPKTGSDKSTPPIQTLPQHLAQMGNLVCHRMLSFCLFVCLVSSKNDILEGDFHLYA